MSHQMTINFSDEVYHRLKGLAAKHGVDDGEVIRRALAMLSACDTHKPEGGFVIITDKDLKPVVKMVGTF